VTRFPRFLFSITEARQKTTFFITSSLLLKEIRRTSATSYGHGGETNRRYCFAEAHNKRLLAGGAPEADLKFHVLFGAKMQS
jgi:hypothetical protein